MCECVCICICVHACCVYACVCMPVCVCVLVCVCVCRYCHWSSSLGVSSSHSQIWPEQKTQSPLVSDRNTYSISSTNTSAGQTHCTVAGTSLTLTSDMLKGYCTWSVCVCVCVRGSESHSVEMLVSSVCACHSKNLESSRPTKCALVLYMCAGVYTTYVLLRCTYSTTLYIHVQYSTDCVCVCVQSDAEWGGAGWVPLCDGAPTERLLHSVLHWNLRQPPDQLPPPVHAHQVLLHNIQLDACYTNCIPTDSLYNLYVHITKVR